jgi:hypothetical protein
MKLDTQPIEDFRRDIPNENPETARLMKICMALTSELTVVRERLDTVERLADKAGLIAQSAIESYEPDPDAAVARDAIRKRIMKRVFRALKLDAERGVSTLVGKMAAGKMAADKAAD